KGPENASSPVGKSWIEENTPELVGKILVSISMEGNIPEFDGYVAQDANTRGGLGAYFGDKLEGLAQIGMHAYGIQPGYTRLIRDGQLYIIDYQKLVDAGIAERVLDANGQPLRFDVYAWDVQRPHADEENPKIPIEVLKINRGGTPDFILLSPVFDFLYNDNKIMRFTQEMVFGKAVYELFSRLTIIPDILHLNEAHTVVAAVQLLAAEKLHNDKRFRKTAIVYTVHTNVEAGLERHHPQSIREAAKIGDQEKPIPDMIKRMIYQVGNIPDEAAGRFLRSGVVDFCYTAAVIADAINGVSDEHALAVDRLFKEMYGKTFPIKSIGVLNGSGFYWKMDALKALEATGAAVTQDQLWQMHEEVKVQQAYAEIKKRTGIDLDPKKPTLWAVRRLVDYKSQYPMLRFLVHLLTAERNESFTRESLRALWLRDIPSLQHIPQLVDQVLDTFFANRTTLNGLGMQVVVGGPEFMPDWVGEFKRWHSLPVFKGKFVYVPRSDARLLKMQAVGADICVNMPRDLEEACGTSDQRTGLNGGVNIALRGAGPVEWVEDFDAATGKGSGFLFGPYTKSGAQGPEKDDPRFYREAPADIFILAERATDIFYNNPDAWKTLMHNSYLRANEKVTAKAMEERYAQRVYPIAIRNRELYLQRRQLESGNEASSPVSNASPSSIIIVCNQNIFRSPILEHYLRAELSGQKARVRSYGVSVSGNNEDIIALVREANQPPSYEGSAIVAILVRRIKEGLRVKLDATDIKTADLILVTNSSLVNIVAAMTGKEGAYKVRLISEFLPVNDSLRGKDIPDLGLVNAVELWHIYQRLNVERIMRSAQRNHAKRGASSPIEPINNSGVNQPTYPNGKVDHGQQARPAVPSVEAADRLELSLEAQEKIAQEQAQKVAGTPAAEHEQASWLYRMIILMARTLFNLKKTDEGKKKIVPAEKSADVQNRASNEQAGTQRQENHHSSSPIQRGYQRKQFNRIQTNAQGGASCSGIMFTMTGSTSASFTSTILSRRATDQLSAPRTTKKATNSPVRFPPTAAPSTAKIRGFGNSSRSLTPRTFATLPESSSIAASRPTTRRPSLFNRASSPVNAVAHPEQKLEGQTNKILGVFSGSAVGWFGAHSDLQVAAFSLVHPWNSPEYIALKIREEQMLLARITQEITGKRKAELFMGAIQAAQAAGEPIDDEQFRLIESFVRASNNDFGAFTALLTRSTDTQLKVIESQIAAAQTAAEQDPFVLCVEKIAHRTNLAIADRKMNAAYLFVKETQKERDALALTGGVVGSAFMAQLAEVERLVIEHLWNRYRLTFSYDSEEERQTKIKAEVLHFERTIDRVIQEQEEAMAGTKSQAVIGIGGWTIATLHTIKRELT
ncbi:MAG: glycogen/starch synthase, partial [Candidatus Omnitrophota bacterium]